MFCPITKALSESNKAKPIIGMMESFVNLLAIDVISSFTPKNAINFPARSKVTVKGIRVAPIMMRFLRKYRAQPSKSFAPDAWEM